MLCRSSAGRGLCQNICSRPSQLRRLSTPPPSVFRDPRAAEFLAAAGSPDTIPRLYGLPEVVVTGRANAGKSTLLNAVLGRNKLLNTSKKAGRTTTLNFFRVGRPPGKLVVVDAPGYGSRGRPEWGAVFEHYIASRVELKRIYVLLNAKNGMNDADREMLRTLSAQCMAMSMAPVDAPGPRYTLQAIITKIDGIPLARVRPTLQTLRKEIYAAAPLCLPPIVTSAEKQPFLGVREVRQSITEACGLGKLPVFVY